MSGVAVGVRKLTMPSHQSATATSSNVGESEMAAFDRIRSQLSNVVTDRHSLLQDLKALMSVLVQSETEKRDIMDVAHRENEDQIISLKQESDLLRHRLREAEQRAKSQEIKIAELETAVASSRTVDLKQQLLTRTKSFATDSTETKLLKMSTERDALTKEVSYLTMLNTTLRKQLLERGSSPTSPSRSLARSPSSMMLAATTDYETASSSTHVLDAVEKNEDVQALREQLKNVKLCQRNVHKQLIDCRSEKQQLEAELWRCKERLDVYDAEVAQLMLTKSELTQQVKDTHQIVCKPCLRSLSRQCVRGSVTTSLKGALRSCRSPPPLA